MVRSLLFSFSYYIVFSSVFAEEIVKDCHDGFKLGPDGESCYRAFFDTKTWNEAQQTCNDFKSNLTSVSSKAELEFIWDSVIDVVYYHYWIGLYKNSSENGWQWVDGTKFDTSWTIWRTGQPTDDDKYALLYLNSAGINPYWSGNTNGDNRHVFICKNRGPNVQPTPTLRTSASTTPAPTTTTTTPSTSTTTTTTPTPIPSASTTESQEPPASPSTISTITPTINNVSRKPGISQQVRLAIGLSCGFGVTIIILLSVLICCLRRKKSEQKSVHGDIQPFAPTNSININLDINDSHDINVSLSDINNSHDTPLSDINNSHDTPLSNINNSHDTPMDETTSHVYQSLNL